MCFPYIPGSFKPKFHIPFWGEFLSNEQEFLSIIVIPVIPVPFLMIWKELQKGINNLDPCWRVSLTLSLDYPHPFETFSWSITIFFTRSKVSGCFFDKLKKYKLLGVSVWLCVNHTLCIVVTSPVWISTRQFYLSFGVVLINWIALSVIDYLMNYLQLIHSAAVLIWFVGGEALRIIVLTLSYRFAYPYLFSTLAEICSTLDLSIHSFGFWVFVASCCSTDAPIWSHGDDELFYSGIVHS